MPSWLCPAARSGVARILPGTCRECAAPCQVLKAIRVGPQTTAAEVALYQDCVKGYLLDTYQKNAVGGTGADL